MNSKDLAKKGTLKVLARAGDAVEFAARPAIRRVRKLGFPYRAPTVPKGIVIEPKEDHLGANFETNWARTPVARGFRRAFLAGPVTAAVRVIASPQVFGVDRLADLARLEDQIPVIFCPNHHSHLDTPLMATVIPQPWRNKVVTAAAADYFFNTRAKGALAALSLNAIPIDREATGRKSAEQIRNLIDTGWSLVIYPEGGRSPDGWGQEWKGGAAYIASRTQTPLIPVFIDGTGSIFGKGAKKLRPGRTRIVFGAPIWPAQDENIRVLGSRLQKAVELLADEVSTDYWDSRLRRKEKATPKLTGPEYNGWRRQWLLSEMRQTGDTGQRRRQKRRWPDIG